MKYVVVVFVFVFCGTDEMCELSTKWNKLEHAVSRFGLAVRR